MDALTRREFSLSMLSGAAAAAVSAPALAAVAGPVPSPLRAIDWSLFVDPESFRYKLGLPWQQSGWTLACDCRVAIRVRSPDCPDSLRQQGERFPPVLEMTEWAVADDEVWLPWPQTPPVWGFGSCPECDGYGYLGPNCSCDECECDQCFHANGRLGPRCLACLNARPKPGEHESEGFGWLPAFHRVGCQLISMIYHRRIQTLPGPIEYLDRPIARPGLCRPHGQPIRFRFASGDGLVMPCDPA